MTRLLATVALAALWWPGRVAGLLDGAPLDELLETVALGPQCSAVMTAGYDVFKQFPVWFFNLPPADNNWPAPTDRPPYATLGATVVGFIDARDGGLLEIVTGPGMEMTLVVDGQPAEHPNPLSHRIQLDPGTHFLQASGTLTGNQWRFMPSWNRALLGTVGFPTATIARPSRADVPVTRAIVRWATTIAAAVLIVGWFVAAFRPWVSAPLTAWIVIASAWLAYVAPRAGNGFAMTGLARWSITLLAITALVRWQDRFNSLRGLFIVIGVPWLVFIGVTSIDHVGKFSLYAGGDDMWMFQRLSYRTYLQGYFLEGGQATFNHQPLYRWIAGALHLLFGDSSIGEFFWDGACFLAIALFAAEVTRRLVDLQWGLIAAAFTLTLIMQGPTWGFFGVGLSETAAAGFIYMAALTALAAEGRMAVAAAGTLAVLGFVTRLNNFPIAAAVAVFAIPLTARAGDWFRPSRWKVSTRPAIAIGVVAAMAVAVFLFTLRTWYYTGVFSATYGLTQLKGLSIWQAGVPPLEVARRMLDSAIMVLSLSDPPQFVWYAIPLFVAAVISIAGIARVPWLRAAPLPLALFFLAGVSGSLVARGSAYSGRFSTIMIGAACAIVCSFFPTVVRSRFSAQVATGTLATETRN